MKVKELLDQLSIYNPDANITFWSGPNEEWVVLSIYSGDLKKGYFEGANENDLTAPDVVFDIQNKEDARLEAEENQDHREFNRIMTAIEASRSDR